MAVATSDVTSSSDHDVHGDFDSDSSEIFRTDNDKRSSRTDNSTRSSNGFDNLAVNSSLRSSQTRAIAPTGRKRSSKEIDGLTVNKLQFSSLGLYGRDDEISLLEKIFDESNSNNSEATTQEKRKKIIFLAGYSGSGKSALAETLRAKVQSKKGIYARGKFDRYHRDRPLSGIASACEDICQQLISMKKERNPVFYKIRKQLKVFMGSSSQVAEIVQKFPPLEAVMEEEGDDVSKDGSVSVDPSLQSQSSFRRRGSLSDTKHRFAYLFRAFLNVISSNVNGLVFVIDEIDDLAPRPGNEA